MSRLLVDPRQIEAFASSVFVHASEGVVISLRTFADDADRALSILPVRINGTGLENLVEAAIQQAQFAADHGKRAVFCPPLAAFSTDSAKEADLAEAYMLSVECDNTPEEARGRLEVILGPATLIVASGGLFTDPVTGVVEPKLHLHWRLTEPATGDDLKRLKQARRLATLLVGGDRSSIPSVHPLRWAGSWHRKGEPRLATIVERRPAEIDLRDALERLEQAQPAPGEPGPREETGGREGKDGRGHGAAGDGDERTDARLIANITSGLEFHDSLVPLAARMLARGMAAGAAVKFLRGLMEEIAREARDTRWQTRFSAIPRIVESAASKWPSPPPPPADDAPKPLDGEEVDLARLLWHHRDLAPVVAPIVGALKPADPRLKALHDAVPLAPSKRDLYERLLAATITPADAAHLVGQTCESALLDTAERAPILAQVVGLRRAEAAVLAAGAAGDFGALEKAWQARESVLAAREEDLFPFDARIARAPEAIPPRRWLYGTAYLRQVVAAIVAPGSTGKSILLITEALAMATGRQLLHHKPIRRRRVLYWNLEDSREEIERRIAAVAKHFNIAPGDYESWLFFESGHHIPLKVAAAARAGFALNTAAIAKLRRTLKALAIDVLALDPIVSAHGVPENDTAAIDAVIKALAALAADCNCAIQLGHHVRKGPPGQSRELEIEDVRGAIAFVNACRIIRLGQRMTSEDGDKVGVPPERRWRYFRLADGKQNNAPPAETSEWLQLVGVRLENGDEENPEGDDVGIVTRWVPPPLTEGLPSNILDLVVEKATGAQHRADLRSASWFGYAIAAICNADPFDKLGKKKLTRLIDTWIENKILRRVQRYDDTRQPRHFIGVPGIDHDENMPARKTAKGTK